MKVWIVRISEPLPFEENVRLWRCGMLAQRLYEAGHEVVWWQSTFDHAKKRHTFDSARDVEFKPGYKIKMLHSIAYKKNVSAARLVNYGKIGLDFFIKSRKEERPDVIVASMPTIEMAAAAVHYGKGNGVPVVVDIRDLWPDIFINPFPEKFRRLAKLAMTPYEMQLEYALKNAAAIVGISQEYLDWGLAKINRPRRDNDRIIYLGYDRRTLSEEKRAAERGKWLGLGVDPKKKICCFFGMFGHTYDLDVVLDAAAVLQAEGDETYQFVLCGDGQMFPGWKKKSEGLRNVIMPGWVSVDAMTALMEMSSIGLAAYRFDAPQSLPNKPFEYFSQNLPIVSSLEGELKDMTDKYGIGEYYKAGDSAELIKALNKAASADQAKTRKKIKKLFDESFDANKVYSDYIKFLEELAAGMK